MASGGHEQILQHWESENLVQFLEKMLRSFECMQTQDQEGYGTQYEVQNFSLPSTSMRDEQHQQQQQQQLPIQVTRA